MIVGVGHINLYTLKRIYSFFVQSGVLKISWSNHEIKKKEKKKDGRHSDVRSNFGKWDGLIVAINKHMCSCFRHDTLNSTPEISKVLRESNTKCNLIEMVANICID